MVLVFLFQPKRNTGSQGSITAENEMYEIRHTDGKGLGVFAKRDIERGTRIMCEEPLISIENKDDVTGMIQGFILLDPDQKALFLSLHRGNDEAREALIETVVRERHGSCMDKVSGMPIQWQVRITRAFDVNSFQKIKGSAIYPKASRLNHSCTPNVNHFWNSSLGRETVTTTRDVKVGEEILISYVRLCRTREQRHEQLQPYGFRCICLACDASTPFGRASENRRKTISALDQSLAMYRQFPKLSPLPGDRAAIRAAMTLSEVFIEEGLDGMDLQRW